MKKPTTKNLVSIEVEQVKAENGPFGAQPAFKQLESRLPSLKGRKMYGVFYSAQNEYFACVDRESNYNLDMGFEKGIIPGGIYARGKIENWVEKIENIGNEFEKLEKACRENGLNLDYTRPNIEFYRSQEELIIYVPVKIKKTG